MQGKRKFKENIKPNLVFQAFSASTNHVPEGNIDTLLNRHIKQDLEHRQN